MVESIAIACFRGAGDTSAGMLGMGIVNVVNISLSWGLTIGLGPLPELGWDGIAIGTAVGHGVGGLLMLAFLIRGRAGLKLELRGLRPDLVMIRRILRIGIPGAVDILTIIVSQLWFLKIVNELGDVSAAAHGVAIRVESFAFLPGAAFQVAAATLAGQYLGARQPRQATRSVRLTVLVAAGVMIVAGIFFFSFGETLARLMVDPRQAHVAVLAARLLRIVAFGMPLLATVMVLTGGLRGAGDTRWPLVFSLIGYLGIRIPLAYLFTGPLGYGVEGAWYAMVIDLGVRSLLVGIRFAQGDWQRTAV
jgi:putative MATE family efflux protein